MAEAVGVRTNDLLAQPFELLLQTRPGRDEQGQRHGERHVEQGTPAQVLHHQARHLLPVARGREPTGRVPCLGQVGGPESERALEPQHPFVDVGGITLADVKQLSRLAVEVDELGEEGVVVSDECVQKRALASEQVPGRDLDVLSFLGGHLRLEAGHESLGAGFRLREGAALLAQVQELKLRVSDLFLPAGHAALQIAQIRQFATFLAQQERHGVGESGRFDLLLNAALALSESGETLLDLLELLGHGLDLGGQALKARAAFGQLRVLLGERLQGLVAACGLPPRLRGLLGRVRGLLPAPNGHKGLDSRDLPFRAGHVPGRAVESGGEQLTPGIVAVDLLSERVQFVLDRLLPRLEQGPSGLGQCRRLVGRRLPEQLLLGLLESLLSQGHELGHLDASGRAALGLLLEGLPGLALGREGGLRLRG